MRARARRDRPRRSSTTIEADILARIREIKRAPARRRLRGHRRRTTYKVTGIEASVRRRRALLTSSISSAARAASARRPARRRWRSRRRRRRAATLVVTTDPAPSLGDALGMRLGRAPAPCARAPRPAPRRRESTPRPRFARWLASARRDAPGHRRCAAPGSTTRTSTRCSAVAARHRRAGRRCSSDAARRAGRYDASSSTRRRPGTRCACSPCPTLLGRVAAVFDAMQEKHRAIVGALRGSSGRRTPRIAFVQSRSDDAVELLGAAPRSGSDRASPGSALPEHVALDETARRAAGARRRIGCRSRRSS